MIVALAGRVIGPSATLVLLAYLAGFPPAYTAQYAVLTAYMQLMTAPLNPYAEHFQLRELLSGRRGGYGVGLAALALLWLASGVLVIALGHSPVILATVPLLGLGHLMLKVLAARLRANQHNGLALVLEFSLRPVALLVLTALVFTLFGPITAALDWAFALTGITTIATALVVYGFVAAARDGPAISTNTNSDPEKACSSPWAFILLGIIMVLASQFEVFALDRLATAEALASYKVALQLASVCGIATNFILMSHLRELYAHDIQSDAYRMIFKKVQLRTLGVSLVFTISFSVIAILYPPFWSPKTWVLAAGAACIFSASAAFGPIGNWLYAMGRLRIVMVSLVVMLLVKSVLLLLAHYLGVISAPVLVVIFATGVLMHNFIMYNAKRKLEEVR